MREIYRSPWFNLSGYLACTVKFEDGTKRTVLQHREIMEKHLSRKLESCEHVHHLDENKRNNAIGNLEVLSNIEHGRQHAKRADLAKLVCLFCSKEFERIARHERNNRKKGKVGPFCGKSCTGKWSRQKQLREGTGPHTKPR